MKEASKNRKGFALAEEVITILLIGILIVSASGILANCMRIFCRNIITLTAQQKGIAVMEQLVENLAYAEEIGTSTTSGTNPYQVQLYLTTNDGKNYLTKKTQVQYAYGGTKNTAENTVCSLSSYTVSYTITAISGENCVTVDLKIQKSGTTYYSERRTITTKNITFTDSTAFSYDSSGANVLYIEGLE